MLHRVLAHTARLVPQAALGHLGWVRGSVGAALGIALSAAIGLLVLGRFSAALPMIVAPMGASAVLVFALPASPLAQPWPLMGGNVLSAITGLLVGALIHSPLLAGALAVGGAIAVMSVTRCLHPPGGACALLSALGATGAEHWGATYAAAFVVNALALGLAAWLYNTLTGHQWPHRLAVPTAEPAPAALPSPRAVPVFSREDVLAVLDDWDEVLDVGPEDLLAVAQALDRQRERRGSQVRASTGAAGRGAG